LLEAGAPKQFLRKSSENPNQEDFNHKMKKTTDDTLIIRKKVVDNPMTIEKDTKKVTSAKRPNSKG
jgi:hypothetical protein